MNGSNVMTITGITPERALAEFSFYREAAFNSPKDVKAMDAIPNYVLRNYLDTMSRKGRDGLHNKTITITGQTGDRFIGLGIPKEVVVRVQGQKWDGLS